MKEMGVQNLLPAFNLTKIVGSNKLCFSWGAGGITYFIYLQK